MKKRKRETNMNNKTLIQTLARRSQYTKHPLTQKQVEQLVGLLAEVVREELAQGQEVRISDLGTLRVEERVRRSGPSPTVFTGGEKRDPEQGSRVSYHFIWRPAGSLRDHVKSHYKRRDRNSS
ncbi:MAG: HU family DNA-binding protein [Chloroflexota bacterium]